MINLQGKLMNNITKTDVQRMQKMKKMRSEKHEGAIEILDFPLALELFYN